MADDIIQTPREQTLSMLENIKNEYYITKSQFFEVHTESRNIQEMSKTFYSLRSLVISIIDRIKHNIPLQDEKESLQDIYMYFLTGISPDTINLKEIYGMLDTFENIMTKYLDRLIPEKLRII